MYRGPLLDHFATHDAVTGGRYAVALTPDTKRSKPTNKATTRTKRKLLRRPDF